MSSALQIQDLAHHYEQKCIFSDIDLHLAKGECVALLGASGCGKSTLLRDIAGLSIPSAGTIHIHEQLVWSRGHSTPIQQRQIGLVFQDYALFPGHNVRQNIAFGLHKLSAQQQHQLVNSWLQRMNLEHRAQHLPSQLSGGQQQRVALARALAPQPKLLLLDEPFANIDSALRQQLGYLVRETLQDEGVSALLVTHDRQDALAFSDKLAVMSSHHDMAKIIQYGTPEEVYQQPCSYEVATLTGNVIRLQGQAQGHTAMSTLGEVPLQKPHHGPVELLIRPEQLTLVAVEKSSFVVEKRFFLGDHYRLVWQDIAVLSTQDFAIGTNLQIQFPQAIWAVTS